MMSFNASIALLGMLAVGLLVWRLLQRQEAAGTSSDARAANENDRQD